MMGTLAFIEDYNRVSDPVPTYPTVTLEPNDVPFKRQFRLVERCSTGTRIPDMLAPPITPADYPSVAALQRLFKAVSSSTTWSTNFAKSRLNMPPLAGTRVRRRYDTVLNEINTLRLLVDEWDGPGSYGPKGTSVDDASAVVQVWPPALPLPVADLGVDGHVVLDIINNDGFAVAGFDFTGESNVAIYSIVDGTKVLETGRLKTDVASEVHRVLLKIASVSSLIEE